MTNATYWLKSRAQFIRDFYTKASAPFIEEKKKIELGEHPFTPSYDEDGEPSFQIEWIQADESIDVLWQLCISLLSELLGLYLNEWIGELRSCYGAEVWTIAEIGQPKDDKKAFEKGMISGYRIFFDKRLGIDWGQSPSNLALLEEIVLVRNRARHPENISSVRIEQSKQDFQKYPRSFFVDDYETQMRKIGEASGDFPATLFQQPWPLKITGEKLFSAIDEVEQFGDWLDQQVEIGLAMFKQADKSDNR